MFHLFRWWPQECHAAFLLLILVLTEGSLYPNTVVFKKRHVFTSSYFFHRLNISNLLKIHTCLCKMFFFKLIFTVSPCYIYRFVFSISVSSQTLRSPTRCPRAGVTQQGAPCEQCQRCLPAGAGGARRSAMGLLRHERSHRFIWKRLRREYLWSST